MTEIPVVDAAAVADAPAATAAVFDLRLRRIKK